MGFRIDTVKQVAAVQAELRREIGFKRVEGKGEYETYRSGIGGKGLFTAELKPSGVEWLPVANSERFCAPPEMPQEDVWSLVATWMKLQGWGPELDRRHVEVHREIVQFVPCDDESGTRCWSFLRNCFSCSVGSKGWCSTFKSRMAS